VRRFVRQHTRARKQPIVRVARGILEHPLEQRAEHRAELRARLEVHTDALSADPWLLLGPERTARVIEIAKDLSRTLVANGALSASGLAKG